MLKREADLLASCLRSILTFLLAVGKDVEKKCMRRWVKVGCKVGRGRLADNAIAAVINQSIYIVILTD